MAPLEFELSNYGVTVPHVSYYTTGNLCEGRNMGEEREGERERRGRKKERKREREREREYV